MVLQGQHIGLKGEFTFTVIRADGTVKKFLNENKTICSGDVVKNRLLDNFFTRISGVDSGIADSFSCRVGTGTSPVLDTQTSLVSQLPLLNGSWPWGAQVNNSTIIEGAFLKGSTTTTFTFDLGQVSGNISEIGINIQAENSAGNTIVHIRSLVVDAQGNPTTIAVSPSEQLILTHTLRFEASIADVISTVPMLINGEPTNVTVLSRWGHLNSINLSGLLGVGWNGNPNQGGILAQGTLGSVNQNVNFTWSEGFSFPTRFYVENGKGFTQTATTTQINPPSGGLNLFYMISDNTPYKFSFDPPIPKNNNRTLSISVQRTFSRL